MLEKLKRSENNTKKDTIQVALINSGLRDLKEEIEDMSEQGKETKNPNEIVDIVEKILEFIRQQEGEGLNLPTPNACEITNFFSSVNSRK